MARILYVHWNKEEALATVKMLRAAGGHTVIYHYSTEEGAGNEAWKQIRNNPPDALVISLARLPSHGRRIATVTREYKALRQVPLIFLDGAEEKVAKAKSEFPDATFTTAKALNQRLARL